MQEVREVGRHGSCLRRGLSCWKVRRYVDACCLVLTMAHTQSEFDDALRISGFPSFGEAPVILGAAALGARVRVIQVAGRLLRRAGNAPSSRLKDNDGKAHSVITSG